MKRLKGCKSVVRRAFCWAFCACLSVTAVQGRDADSTGGDTPREVAAWLGLGWNLGNQFDAHADGVAAETAWGQPPATPELFRKVAEAGFTSVRIPVTWLGHIGPAPDYHLDSPWLDRVEEVVDDAAQAGLRVMLNIHHDGADSRHWLDIKKAATDGSVNEAVKAQLRAVWTQIAGRFKDKSDFLIFESMNEIHDGGWGWGANRTDNGRQYAVLNEWNQVFVDAVRSTGGNNATRYLGVPGYCANPELTVEHFVMPKDKVEGRLMVAIHFYDPVDYTLEAKCPEWGHTARPGKAPEWGGEDNVVRVFSRVKERFIDRGIPVYIGEMGCVRRGDERGEAFRRYYLEYVCKAARTYGMAPFVWDNGLDSVGRECSGLFDRKNGAFFTHSEDVVRAMVKAVFSDYASYTLEAVYQTAP